MNENLKTLTFVVVASAAALIAWASKPSLPTSDAEEFRNQLLYPDFKNPLDAASLEIVKYDETKGVPTSFTVAEIPHKGKVRWSIPSHDDYPADAKNQIAEAATALMGLKVIEKVSDNEGDQEEYCVVDPDPKVLKIGSTGVGERVVMRDRGGKELLALVVGKQVPERPDLRYVRKSGDANIFIVEAKTDKLSTKFEDWIEPNLLQINTMDLKDVLIRDYSSRRTARGLGVDYRGRMDIAFNEAAEPHWTMLKDEKFALAKSGTTGAWEALTIAADQELNAPKLDELKTALDDLKIVDVSRKPAGLRADLKLAADFAKNEDALESLEEKGFFPAQLEENGPMELFSNEGEVRLVMKNGIEYVLRFGQIADVGATAKDTKKKDKEKDAKKAKDKDKKGPGVNRYLFVMAEFNRDAIPKPTMEKYVEPVKAKEPEKKPTDEKKPDAKPGEKKPDAKPADAKPADKKPDDKKPDAKKPDEKKPEPAKSPELEKKIEEAVRARIEKENKRKRDEYDQQMAAGKKRVDELNARFADWYYVISDDVYRKIHLSRSEIVTKKVPKKEVGKGGEDMGMMPGQEPPIDVKMPRAPVDESQKPKQEAPAGK